MTEAESNTAAFFDLDGTLLSVNSTTLWIRRELKSGRISRFQYLQGLGFLLAYKFGIVNMDHVMQKALGTIRGMQEDTIIEWTRDWYHKEVRHFKAPGAQPVIDTHRRLGHKLVLLTSSSPYEAEFACRDFDLDHYLSSRYEVQNGLFTGDLVRPLCYGRGKVDLAEEYARTECIDLDKSFFYTDSYTDLPMLQRVGNPYVVHPDPRLKLKAKANGWPILDWR